MATEYTGRVIPREYTGADLLFSPSPDAPPVVRQQRPRTSEAAQIAAFPMTRFALGAAAPFLGAAEWLPGSAGRSAASNNAELRRLIEEGARDQSESSEVIGGGFNLAGNILSPLFLKAGAMAPAIKTKRDLVATGTAMGLLGGATAPIGSADIEDKLIATGVGGVAGAVATPIVASAARLGQNLLGPMVSQRQADLAGARIATKAAGERADDVIANLQQSSRIMPAAETALPAKSSEFSAIERMMRPHAASQFDDIALAEQRARVRQLELITPDLKKAEQARKIVSERLYKAAFGKKINADPELAQLSGSPFFQKAMRESDDLMNSRGVTFKNRPVEFLHGIKLGFDKMLSRRGDTALGEAERRAVVQEKAKLVSWLEKRVPEYATARTTFAKMSAPIDQARTLQAMRGKLESPSEVGERATPFLNVLNSGEEALLKRSTGAPRFEAGDLKKVLSPQQFKVVSDISDRLKSKAELSAREKSGMVGALKALRATSNEDVRAPSLVDYRIALINRLLNQIEGLGGGRAQEALARLSLPQNTRLLGRLMQESQANPYGAMSTVARYSGGGVSPVAGMLTGGLK